MVGIVVTATAKACGSRLKDVGNADTGTDAAGAAESSAFSRVTTRGLGALSPAPLYRQAENHSMSTAATIPVAQLIITNQ